MIKPIASFPVYGVNVSLDISIVLMVILAWIYWGYNGNILAFLLGMILVILAFISVLAHELGHAFAARERGAQVLGVTLSPLAGVARIEQGSSSPADELFIAFAGPAVNLAIFMLLLPWTLLVSAVRGPSALFSMGDRYHHLSPANMLAAVAALNLGLMIFNLIPAFPLDGGRVVRAFLNTRMTRRQATTIATRVGYAIAALFVVLGIFVHDPLLVLLGIFIVWAAYNEARVVRIEDQMQSLVVGSYALWDGGGISPEVPLSYALRGGPRDMVVTQRGRVVGMLWRNDLLRYLEGGVSGRTVADVMQNPAYIADVAETLWDVQREMAEVRTRAIPVTEKGLYRGVFSAERFRQLYRQVSPGLGDFEWELDEEWRSAVLDTFRRRGRKK